MAVWYPVINPDAPRLLLEAHEEKKRLAASASASASSASPGEEQEDAAAAAQEQERKLEARLRLHLRRERFLADVRALLLSRGAPAQTSGASACGPAAQPTPLTPASPGAPRAIVAELWVRPRDKFTLGSGTSSCLVWDLGCVLCVRRTSIHSSGRPARCLERTRGACADRHAGIHNPLAPFPRPAPLRPSAGMLVINPPEPALLQEQLRQAVPWLGEALRHDVPPASFSPDAALAAAAEAAANAAPASRTAQEAKSQSQSQSPFVPLPAYSFEYPAQDETYRLGILA